MSLPNKLTIVRLVLSPLLFIVFFIPVWSKAFAVGSVVLVWIIFLVIESTDVLDGHLARKWDQVSDIGKVLDPFADVVSRLTYFICFTGVGVMPIWVLAILVYREIAITFLRSLMFRRGVAVAANIWGKSKAVTYAVAGLAGFVVVSFRRLALVPSANKALSLAALVIFLLAVIASVGSFLTYLRALIASERATR